MRETTQCFIAGALLALMGCLCQYVDDQRARIAASAYAAEHVCHDPDVSPVVEICYVPDNRWTFVETSNVD
jgi:hypothetical protein